MPLAERKDSFSGKRKTDVRFPPFFGSRIGRGLKIGTIFEEDFMTRFFVVLIGRLFILVCCLLVLWFAAGLGKIAVDFWDINRTAAVLAAIGGVAFIPGITAILWVLVRATLRDVFGRRQGSTTLTSILLS